MGRMAAWIDSLSTKKKNHKKERQREQDPGNNFKHARAARLTDMQPVKILTPR